MTSIATVVAAGAALFFLAQQSPVKQAEDAKTGTIEIYTDPDDATILIDGKERSERSDATIEVGIGTHEVTLQLAGYDEAEIPIEVFEDQPAVIEHTFVRDGETVTEESADDFKTYRNAKYGYRIRYPSRWEPDEQSPEVVTFLETGGPRPDEHEGGDHDEGEHTAPLTILVQDNPKNLGPEAWYKDQEAYPHEDQSAIKQRGVTVNDRPGYQYETPYGFVPYLITIVTGKNQAFLFQQVQDSPNRKLYDQVIQTFTLE
ncbi:MAG: PEGA domain-containing protein [bacterium]|nr:PEGA domain-containing protein [bacterium]